MSFLGIKNPLATGKGAVTTAARNANAAREGRASNLTSLIDSSFITPGREQQTQDFMGALRAQLGDTTNRAFADTSRQKRFATARAGLTGGSVDINRQKRTLEDLFKRRISDESQVQDAGQGLRTQDLATRQSLINSAYGTADVGQDAMRRMITGQGSIANYTSGLLPNHLQDVGQVWANNYGVGQENYDYDRARKYWTGG
jgi:hypothetical protein